MRIAIINLTGGGLSGGYKKYLRNMLPLLSVHKDVEAILCASPIDLSVHLGIKPLNKIVFAICSPYQIIGRKDLRLFQELAAFNPDVIFIPMERFYRYEEIPVVCMVRNMLPMANIRHISIVETVRNRIQKMVAHQAVRKATRVISVSSFVSNYINKEWGIRLENTTVIYHGVSPIVDEEIEIHPLIPLDWIDKCIFTAGAIELYRGIEDIIYALSRLRKEGHDLRLIIAGSARPAMMSYYRKLKNLANEIELGESICWPGMLNEKEMGWCFKNALAFIMSSKIEACPNVALEAMSYGSVIISSTAPPMREFFREAAKYYKSGDDENLARLIAEVVHLTAAKKNNLSQTARRRASDFTWEKTCNETVRELRKAVDEIR